MAEKINESQQVRFVSPNGSGLAMMNTSPYHIPFILQRIEGIGGVEANISSQKSPYQDGTSFFSANLEPRDVSIRVTINAKNRKELFEYREYVQEVFYPSHGEGILIVQHGDKTRMTYAVAETTPTFFDYIGNQVSFVVNLVASDPFWYQYDDNGTNTLTSNGVFKINSSSDYYGSEIMIFPEKGVQTFSTSIETERKIDIISNDGLSSTPFEIVIPETSSFSMIKRKTSEEIRLIKPILEGESLIIQTELGRRKVTLSKPDGTFINAFNYISRDSDFFYLDSGENRIEFNVGEGLEGEDNIDVSPYLLWNPRYSGI